MVPTEPCIAGSAVLDGRQAYIAIVGELRFTEAVRTLPPEQAAVYEATTMVSWVPVRIVDAMIRAVAAASGHGAIELNTRASRLSVERTVRTVLRPFLRLTTVEALLTRAPILYRKSYSHGALGVFSVDEARAVLALVDWPTISDLQVAGIGAGMVAILAVCGRNAAVHTRRSPTGAIFTIALRQGRRSSLPST